MWGYKMTEKKRLDQQGFTLIETVVAIGILSIGIVTLISMQTTAIRGNSQASHQTIASDWSADQLEQIFAWEYTIDGNDNPLLVDQTGNGVGGFDHTDEAGALADGGPIVSPDGSYTIYWNIADDLLMPETKSVRVIVERQEKGVIKTVTMDYLKAKYL